MDDLEFLILVILLIPVAILIMSIVALVKASRASSQVASMALRLDRQFKEVERRLGELEAAQDRYRTLAETTDVPEVTQPVVDPEDAEPEPQTSPEAPDEAGPPQSPEDATDQDEDTAEDQPPPGQPWLAARQQAEAGAAPDTSGSRRSRADIESAIGGRWSVLLGGLALALGVVFLVRHTIEAGLLGPAARIALGAAFSVLLLAAGEWLRRSDRSFDLPVYEKADVPGILTGAGAIGAFATLFAAHALYGFIGPGAAFVGLTVIGIATMALSSIHGPKLAALGVVGAYGAPLLVSTDDPNPVALALHVLVVTATVLAIAHLRDWRWLAVCGFVAASAWTALAGVSTGGDPSSGLGGTLMILGSGVLFAALFWMREAAEIADHRIEPTAILGFGLLFLAFLLQLGGNPYLTATFTGTALAAIIAGLAAMRTSAAPAVSWGVLAALATVAASNLPFPIREGLTQTFEVAGGLVPPDVPAFVRNALVICVPVAAISLLGTRRNAVAAPIAGGWLASAVSAVAFFGLLLVYLRVSPFETRPLIGAIALGLAALLAMATEYFTRLKPEDMTLPAPAALAVGAIATACLAISISLDTGWMPLAFSLTALGITLVYRQRPLAVLPWLSMAAGGIAGLTLWANMPLELPQVAGWPILNSLIVLLGIPALALIGAGEVLHRAGHRAPVLAITALSAGGLAVAGLFVAFEITHFINDGSLANVRHSLAEIAGYALAALGFTIGLQKLGEHSSLRVYDVASQVAGILSVAISAIGLLVVYNPAFTGEPVGSGVIFNLLLPAYLLTAAGAAAVALLSRPVRPRWYTLMYAALAGVLFFTYCSLMLRKAFQGENLGLYRSTSDLEFWLYSPLWLILGAVLLAIGLRMKSLPLRIASGLLISLTVVKVFLLDMASLTGILRALSFIGLGISLIVIGRFYQRILTRQSVAAREAQQEAPENPENDGNT